MIIPRLTKKALLAWEFKRWWSPSATVIEPQTTSGSGQDSKNCFDRVSMCL